MLSTTLYSRSQNKVLSGWQKLVCMGIPCRPEEACFTDDLLKCGFPTESLSEGEMTHLAGNAMSVHCVGAVLAAIGACVVPTRPKSGTSVACIAWCALGASASIACQICARAQKSPHLKLQTVISVWTLDVSMLSTAYLVSFSSSSASPLGVHVHLQSVKLGFRYLS